MAQGILLNVMCLSGWEGSSGENGYMHIMTEPLCCPPETITTLFLSWLYPNTKQKSLKIICVGIM